MQRGEKDFAKKASVNVEKRFFNYFLGCFGEKKKLVGCNEKDFSPIDFVLKYYPESQMYVTHTE